MGDSVAAGEGNPDRPIALADEGFCFRRFLGAARGEYFRPSRLGYKGDKACDDNPAGSPTSASDWNSHGARWMSAACHRSLYGYQLAHRARARDREQAGSPSPSCRSPAPARRSRAGLFGSQGASDCPPRGRCAGTVPPQIEQLQDVARQGPQADMPSRRLDLVLLTVGANDIKFSGLVADVIISAGVERDAVQPGRPARDRAAGAGRCSIANCPTISPSSATALKPLVGGNLSRVVYVSYGHPALEGDAPCPGGRDGLDIHPAFTADGTRLKNVTDFVLTKFLPKVKALARCEARAEVRQPRHRPHDLRRCPSGRIRRSRHLRPLARTIRSSIASASRPTARASSPIRWRRRHSPLVCSLRPSEFRPYAPRARWIRTANDSYFTAMTYPRGLSSTMQPSNIHDASWGAMSAVYGGAFHPSAEGHAAMADAALPAAREVLGLKAPPEVIAQPLPPPGGQIAPPQ